VTIVALSTEPLFRPTAIGLRSQRALSRSLRRTCLGPSDSSGPPHPAVAPSFYLPRARVPESPVFFLPFPLHGREKGWERGAANVRVLHVVGMHAVHAFFPRAIGARVEGAKGCVRLVDSRANSSRAPPRRRVARNRELSHPRDGAARCVKNQSLELANGLQRLKR